MTALAAAARQQIKDSGVTVAEYTRAGGWDDGKWHGDGCGCTDDRCAGHHHDENEDCGCLPVLIEEIVVRRTYGESARPSVWGEICSCGRPARVAYVTETHGRIGFCGITGAAPLDPCDDTDCPRRVSRHDRAWCANRRDVRTADHG